MPVVRGDLQVPARRGAGASAELVRQSILRLVRERPGIHKSALARESGLAWGTISYHLNILVKRGDIRVHAMTREVLVFPGQASRNEIVSHLAINRGALALLSFLRANPGRWSARRISVLVGVDRRIVGRQLKELRQGGLLHRHDDADDGRDGPEAEAGAPSSPNGEPLWVAPAATSGNNG